MKTTLAAVLLLGALASPGFALETSAGADNVNASQVGINAKLDASNVVLQTGINQILNCQKTGKLLDSTTGACVAVDEPLAKKIAACTTAKEWYNQATDSCQAAAPDLTSQLNTTNTNLGNATALLQKILACNANKQFYDQATGQCQSGSGGTLTYGKTTENWGTFGVMVNCPAGSVVTGVCSSGKNADCPVPGTKLFTAINCTKLTIQ